MLCELKDYRMLCQKLAKQSWVNCSRATNWGYTYILFMLHVAAMRVLFLGSALV